MVSVVIPTYNRENTLAMAINSVLNQTFTDLEVIVVDDCSTDQSKKVIGHITDPRLRYTCLEKNSGACAARNRGIELATGNYIAFHDSDDEWHPEKLSHQLQVMEQTNADFVFCSFEKRFDNGRIWIHPKELTPHFCTTEELLMASLASTQTILGKAEAVRDIMFDVSMPRWQDYDFIIRASMKYNIYYTDKVLVTLYEQENAITAGKRSYEKHQQIAEKFLEKYPQLCEKHPAWELQMLKIVAHSQVMLKQDASQTLRTIYHKDKNIGNWAKILLYKTGLLYVIWDRRDG